MSNPFSVIGAQPAPSQQLVEFERESLHNYFKSYGVGVDQVTTENDTMIWQISSDIAVHHNSWVSGYTLYFGDSTAADFNAIEAGKLAEFLKRVYGV